MVTILIFLFLTTLAIGIALCCSLTACSCDVNTLLTNTDAFLTLTLLSGFLFTLLLAFLLRLTLWSCTLIDSIKIYLTQYVNLSSIQDLLLRLCSKRSSRLSSFHFWCLYWCLWFCCRLFCWLHRFFNCFYRFFNFNRSLNNLSRSLNRLLLLSFLNNRFFYLGDRNLCLHFYRLFLSLNLLFHLFLCLWFTHLIQVYLAKWFKLRFSRLLKQFHLLFLFLRCHNRFLRFLILDLLKEQLDGILLHILVAFKLLNKCIILLVTEFEVRISLYLTQFLLLLKEVDSRLQTDVQLSDCFI